MTPLKLPNGEYTEDPFYAATQWKEATRTVQGVLQDATEAIRLLICGHDIGSTRELRQRCRKALEVGR